MSASSTWDKYPDLSPVIDVGGEIFDLKAETNVNSGYKGRTTFYQTFHPRIYGSLPVEYLLRKYLPVYQNADKIPLNDEDYKKLMDVLRRRAQQLHDSDEYTSHVIKNIPIRRYEANLLALMERLRKGRVIKKASVPKLSENDIFQLLLELSWYLANPSEVPSDMEKEWKIVIENLQEQRLTDVLEAIREAEKEKGLPSEEHPLQYFKKLNMEEVTSANTLEEAKQRVQQMATFVEAQPIRPNMGKRLRNLMNVLHLKRYVDDDTPKNEDGIPILNTNQLKRNLISNPMSTPYEDTKINEEKTSGGGKKKTNSGKHTESALSIPLGQAMLPVFRYLQMLFDPIYGILEQITTSSAKKTILPHLLTLLHLCNEFNSPTTKLEFGLYHLKNIPQPLLVFLRDHLKETEHYVLDMKSDTEREVFQRQLFHLPKVRLRSMIRNNGALPTMKDRETVYHIQFYITGENLLLPEEIEFKKKNPTVDTKTYDSLNDELKPSSVFICYTDSFTTTDNIPFNFFQINYEDIKINESGIKVESFSPKLDQLVKDGMLPENSAKVDKLLTIKPYSIYNDAELALSVLMGLKELMPK